MKLLILTQKVSKNDPILGFFHKWLEEFAKHCQSVIVICLEKGEHNLPENVRVLSLGKENGLGRIKYLFNFFRYIWRERKNYNEVFVHMNPEYVVLGGLFWRWWGKKIALWYTHKSVNLKLRIASRLSHLIFTASPESFRLKNKKVRIVGHGIDTELFRPQENQPASDVFKIISAGRISPVKNQLAMVKIFAELLPQIQKPINLLLAGVPVMAGDNKYLQQIKDFIASQGLQDKVFLLGAVTQPELVKYYQQSDLLLNLSQTGSLDKDVLEASACNLDVLTANEAFKNILPNQYLASGSEDEVKRALLDKVNNLTTTTALRQIVESRHGLSRLIKIIIDSL